ncbi:MAG: hypothetical protein PHV85_04115 [Desulfovibrionaceae bacterium]|nr:hypothetical protein [Desulfovibrionaceae bacterium]MDD4951715.1 hypothetical protein [Desulfovibrionaceae bacterium]
MKRLLSAAACLGLVLALSLPSALAEGCSIVVNDAFVREATDAVSVSKTHIQDVPEGASIIARVLDGDKIAAKGLTGIKNGDLVRMTDIGDGNWRLEKP